jgi:hypothetical protein
MVPLITSIITSAVWLKTGKNAAGWWLNLLLFGGVAFGVIDHIWFGEFLLGFEQLFTGTFALGDLLLGFTITGGIFGVWFISLGLAKFNPKLGKHLGLLTTNNEDK